MNNKKNTELLWKCFISWLKVEKIYANFFHNSNNCGKEWINMYFQSDDKQLKNSCSPSQWVQYAFEWLKTTENVDYWHDYHIKWYDFITENINTIISIKKYDRVTIENLICK